MAKNSSCKLLNFINQENEEITKLIHNKLREIYGRWIAFCCFAFTYKLVNLFSFLWNIPCNLQSLCSWIKDLFTFELKYKNYELQETFRFVNKNFTDHELLFLKKLTFVVLTINLIMKKVFKKYICIYLLITK